MHKMIFGIGNDVIEIERIRKACVKEAFLCRVFTEKEIGQSNRKPSYLAGCFAAKEAVAKAFGTGFRNFGPGEIEVLRDGLGKPYITLYGNAKYLAESLEISSFHVTLTNTATLAFSTVIAESR